MAVRRWLPPNQWNGLAFGFLLLVVVATRVDPLRPENRDFDLVGPGWLSVVVFSAVVVGYGMLVAALAARYSRWLPPLKKDVKTIAKYSPAYFVWGPSALVLAVPLIFGCGGAVLLTRARGLDRIVRSRRAMLVARVLGVAIAATATPGFLIGVADIAARG
jgi:hypothetical protein